jgi:transformer-2 protein
LYLSNLSKKVKDYHIEEMFSGIGVIENISVILDPTTKESRGFGFITFKRKEDASEAIEKVNHKELKGNKISVQLSRRKKPRTKTPGKYLGHSKATSDYPRKDRCFN